MEKSRGIDSVVVIGVVLIVIEAITILFAQRSFTKMFEDFGSEIPWLARLMISPLVPLVLGGGAALFGIEGLLRRREERAMVARAAVLFVVVVALPITFIIGVYLPIFSIAGSIK